MAIIEPVARIFNDLPSKFGIPRQSGLVREVESQILLEPAFRDPEALRGIEQFSHLWLIWGFSEHGADGTWSPTVRPPRLGGNTRLGVFATRSPNRPNSLGLSSVELSRVELAASGGPILYVLGADLMNGSPIYDIKPYIPYSDCRADARAGYASEPPDALSVIIPAELRTLLTPTEQLVIEALLAQDPRPSYQDDPERVYGMSFGGWNVRFCVKDSTLRVTELRRL